LYEKNIGVGIYEGSWQEIVDKILREERESEG